MSRPTETALQTLQLYTTADYPCSYLPQRVARSQVAAPAHLITSDVYDRLIEHGFRRSGLYTYRPQCRDCQACIPIRIDARAFEPRRSQRRAWRRHQHLSARMMPLHERTDHYDLYCRYQQARHAGAGMDEDMYQQYTQFLLASAVTSRLVEFRDPEGFLQMVSLVDLLDNGLSAVYTFFDPQVPGSLGTYAILWQMQQCQEMGLPWLYLGYWIANSPKMAYKSHFQPAQLLRDGQWVQAHLAAPS